jgi:hypothetical protein
MARQYSNSDTAAALRALGFHVGITQHWNHAAQIRQDFLGGYDIIAFRSDFGILAVQATTKNNLAAQRTRMEAHEPSLAWLAAAGHLHIWSWRKVGPQGSRRVWEPRLEKAFLVAGKIQFGVIDIDDLTPPDVAAAA